MYKVVEKFVSINGEGQKSGELAVFIRLAGCNLTCSYCDTMWANQKDTVYRNMSKEKIYLYIQSTGVKNVTLTGGEPLMAESVKELIDFITADKKINLEIETNGSIGIKPFQNNRNNLSFTVDYKSPSSLMNEHMLIENYIDINKRDTLKFVVGSKEDLIAANQLVIKFDLVEKCKVYLSPIFGEIKMTDIVEFMTTHNMNGVKLQIQMHKVIWDPNQIGV